MPLSYIDAEGLEQDDRLHAVILAGGDEEAALAVSRDVLRELGLLDQYSKAWDESEHPRDDHGRFSDAGGGDESVGFVSPNVRTDLDFNGAVDELKGPQQAALMSVSNDIDRALGIKAKETGIIGAWADGAENSVMMTAGSDWNRLVLATAMKAHLADQKSGLVFQRGDGSAVLSHFEAKGKLKEIHRNLLQDGLTFHTLVPTASGAIVYVADLDGSMLEAVKKGAERYDAKVTVQFGKAEFIGDTSGQGSDREQRDRAREIYEGIIRESPVSGSERIWAGIRDRWGKATEVSDDKVQALFDAFEKAPTTEGILAAEENWFGGIANFGDREAALDVQAMPVGYFDYRSHLEEAARKILGDEFPVYRYMPRSQLEDWRNGADLDPMATSLSKIVAESWSKFAAHAAAQPDERVLVRIMATPESILMRGSYNERELVIDPNEISAHKVAEIRSAKAWDESEHPRDEHGRWTDAGDDGSDSVHDVAAGWITTAREQYGYHTDNPGGEWLQHEQDRAAADMTDSSKSAGARKGLSFALSTTAVMGQKNPVPLPTAYLELLKGVNDERPGPGNVKYDRLMQQVKDNGWEPDHPISIAVNFKGQAYIAEGNTRVAVASVIRQNTVQAEIHWVAGGEQASSGLTPRYVIELSQVANKIIDVAGRQDNPISSPIINSTNELVAVANNQFDTADYVQSVSKTESGPLAWVTQTRFSNGQYAHVNYSGTVEQARKMASETVVALGGDKQEIGVLVTVGGSTLKEGRIGIGIRTGTTNQIEWKEDPAEPLMLSGHGMFELYHNHPASNGPISTGDIEFLNGHRNLLAIHASNADGSLFTVRIPGRTAEKWGTIHPSGNLKRALESALIASIAENPPHPEKEKDDLFLTQHATNLGLQDAGLIEYEFKLTADQQKALNFWSPEVMTSIRRAIANAAKSQMPKAA